MAKVILSVPNISCEHCQRTITSALVPVAGVQSVNVDIPTRQVTVDYDDTVTSVRQFEEILQEEDYPVAPVI
jgi:copper chaperone CopZ